MSSPEIWYATNEWAGAAMVVAGILALLTNLAILHWVPHWRDESALLFCVVIDAILVGIAVLVPLIVSERL
jgi:hypothetical protein